MAGLPRLPGLSQAVSIVSTQAGALARLPRTLLELNSSILRLVEGLGSARDTMASLAQVAARMERVLEELEEPVIALRPGLERLARVLDDDSIDDVPETLRSIREDVLPLLAGLRDTQSRVNALATVLPGASLLFPRRPKAEAQRTIDVDVDPALADDPELADAADDVDLTGDIPDG
jgi:ABC-type transporter Mla subunit MlaD